MADERETDTLQSEVADSTDDSAADTSNPRRVHLYLSVFILNLSYVQSGAAYAWSSPVLVKLQLSDTEGSTVASMVPLGSLLGPYVSGIVTSRFGHKSTAGVGMVIMSISWMLLALDTSFIQLTVGRFLGGITVGIALSVLPAYIAEISEDCVRGPLNTLMMLSYGTGSLLVYAIGPYVSYAILNYTMFGTCVLFFLLFPLLPNSPYMLVMQNKMEQARDTLTWLRENRSPAFIERELLKIKKTVHNGQEEKLSLKHLFALKSNRRSLEICCVLLAVQKFGGASIVLFYLEKIFLMTGADISSSISSTVFGVILTLSSFICPVSVKYYGYKIPLLASAFGMGLGIGGLGLFFFLKFNHFDVGSLQWMPLICLVFYIISFRVGIASIPWALMGELFPSNVRPIGSALVTSSAAVNTFLTVNLFPHLVNLFGIDLVFFGCSLVCFTAVIYTLKAVPETSGLSFVEIQEIMVNNRKDQDLKLDLQEKNINDFELKT